MAAHHAVIIMLYNVPTPKIQHFRDSVVDKKWGEGWLRGVGMEKYSFFVQLVQFFIEVCMAYIMVDPVT